MAPSKRPRPVTMDDVAIEAGVSRALVSLVVRGVDSVTETRRSAVLAAIEKLGYRPNKLASRLASHHTRTVGLLILDIRNSIYADLVDGVYEALHPHRVQPLIALGSRDPDAERAALESLIDQRVDGVVVAGFLGRPSTFFRTVGNTPAVLLTRHFPLGGVDSVSSHDERGAELAVEHLIALGHRRIAHISAPTTLPYPGRRAGYLSVMSRHGLTPQVVESDLSEDGGRHAIDELLMAGVDAPTAVFCFNDSIAFGVLRRLDALGISVPDEVALVGYDDTSVGSLERVGLTSVAQRSHDVGRRGAEMLLTRVADPTLPERLEQFEPVLRIRNSTVGVRPAMTTQDNVRGDRTLSS